MNIFNGTDPGARLAGPQPVPNEEVNRTGGAFDNDVAVVDVVNHGAVTAGDADASLHRAADADVPEITVMEIARGLGSELEAIAAGFEIGIPDINVRAVDPPAEGIIAFDTDGVIAATG